MLNHICDALSLVHAQIKYSKYIDLNSAEVRDLAKRLERECKDSDLESRLKCAMHWFRKNIKAVSISPKLFTPRDVVIERVGTCFSISCLLCSVLRIWNLKNVFVVVLSLANAAAIDRALHSFVLVVGPEKDTKVVLDPVSDRPFIKLSTLDDIQRIGKVVCLFNDMEACIAKP